MITPEIAAGLAALAALAYRKAHGQAPPPGPPKTYTRAQAALRIIAPAADRATRAAGCPGLFPVAVAQAMLETGWGRAVPGKNWYGIKGKGPAGSVNVPTREEFAPGTITKTRANFRAYESSADSVLDWLRFVTGGRYAPARTMSPASAALWIWANGYATASRYVPALAATSKRIALLTGLPFLAINLTPAQREIAATLGALPPQQRRTAAIKLRQGGQWPA